MTTIFKTCNECYIIKNENEFYARYAKCKECIRTKNKKAYRIYYKNNGRVQQYKKIGLGLNVLFNQ
jgi:hypothetical protein